MSQHSSKVAVKSAADVGVGGEFTELEREKTVMLEELVTLRCDDIAKVLEVDESLITDLRQRHSSTCCSIYDAWSQGNQALRQMYSASQRAPRLRRFPMDEETFKQQQQQQEKVLHQHRRQRLPPIRPSAAQIHRVIQPPPPPSPETPFSVAVDPEEIRVDEAAEKMLTTLADQVVSESLSAAADAAQLHLTAVRLVGLTVESAQRRLHRMNSSSSNASASSRAAFDG
ncbi:hypothetical protein BOX15_Mlig012854g1 [Macrostomum lignano]|uniref:Uncharacterized protein n=2 Tax=Macrostomum lignano TaxID=282301 RepID=A0A1I8J3H0_9PLAT|nr:hypothetical protein BOX15_Mlig012854g1 [Macrostomum lignano]